MTKSLLILGRQPELSLVEVYSLYGKQNQISQITDQTALVNLSYQDINFERLGGLIKLAEVLSIEPLITNNDLLIIIKQHLEKIISTVENKKITLGVSFYDTKISLPEINKLKISLKSFMKSQGKSTRLIPNNTAKLSSAQVYHNNLIAKNNIEFIIVKNNNQIIIAKTKKVQDINSYTNRDRYRPKRDTRIGMLPPKLAQIIINLASDNTEESNQHKTLLDPFCGTGVILQEALLMNYNVIGSDILPNMVAASSQNINWLKNKYSGINHLTSKVMLADATNYHWQPTPNLIACETYLGKPFTTPPSTEVLNQTISDCQLIIKKFLINLNTQLPQHSKLCIAVPAWYQYGKFIHLPLIDQLSKIGYNHISFEIINNRPLIYHRSGQFVARELLVLQTF